MTKTCILTDSTAQFPLPAFTGREIVNTIPLHVSLNGTKYPKSQGVKAADFPTQATKELHPQTIPPSVEEFAELYVSLSSRYEEIVVILHSSRLTKTFENAVKAAKTIQGHTNIVLIDSHTIATGLGLVVLKAAEAVTKGMNAEEIEEIIRSLLPRIYTVFVIEGLTYLHHSGYLSEAQSLVAEFMKMTPLYVLDNGRLAPTQKARNYRHLVDLLHEFVCEFEFLDHIAFIQGVPAFESETRSLRERIMIDFEETPISEHTINPALAAMFGPRSLGMFILQSEDL